MIIDPANHKSVSNEGEGHRELHARREGGVRPASVIESVPGYRRLTGRRRTQLNVPLNVLPGPHTNAPVVSASAASFGTVSHPEIVIGDDDRRLVQDTTASPWRHICALRIRSAKGTEYVGTGWFIGPTTVVTAGHCVFLHDDGGWPESIRVIPALDGNVEPLSEVTSRRFRATQGWIDGKDTNCDYGVIQIGNPLGTAAGWFAFGVYEDDALKSTDANICGYPYDRDAGTRQYFHARCITTVSAERLYYEIDTFGGQSGSPIWITVEGQRVAIGVHTTGSGTSNSGTRIIREVFENLLAWKNEHSDEARVTVAAPPREKVGIGRKIP